MGERVTIRQDRDYVTSTTALGTDADAHEPREVQRLAELTPYGMVLAALGTCTAFVVNSFAARRGVRVDAVVLTLEYERTYREDCERCRESDEHEERIRMTVAFEGELAPQDREKLFRVALYCPVHKMLTGGVEVVATPG